MTISGCLTQILGIFSFLGTYDLVQVMARQTGRNDYMAAEMSTIIRFRSGLKDNLDYLGKEPETNEITKPIGYSVTKLVVRWGKLPLLLKLKMSPDLA